MNTRIKSAYKQCAVRCLLCILPLLLVSCDKEDAANNRKSVGRIRFAQLPITYSAVTYISEKQGYMQSRDLQYVSFSVPAGPDVVTSLKARGDSAADAGGIAVTPVVTMIGAGQEPIILATTLTSDRQTKLVTFSQTGITESAETLKSKRIGVVKNTNGDVYLWRLLRKAGLKRTDIQIATGRPADLCQLLLRGDVDAAILWDPFVVQLSRQYTKSLLEHKTKDRGDIKIILDPSLYTLAFNIVTTRDHLNSKRKELTALLRGVVRASDFIQSHPKEAQNMLEQWLSLEPGDLNDFMATTDFRVTLDVPKVRGLIMDELAWLKDVEPSSRIPTDIGPYIDTSVLGSIAHDRVHE